MSLTLPRVYSQDHLVWKGSGDGILSLKASYNYLRTSYELQMWCNYLWKKFIPPKFSMTVWRILQHRIPSDDILRSRGICIVSVCALCDNASVSETMDHLFVECVFAQQIWRWLSSLFRLKLPPLYYTSELWDWIVSRRFSPQLFNLWLTISCYAFYSIWKTRNRLRFEDEKPSFRQVQMDTMAHLHFFAKFCPGFVRYGMDRDILVDLGIPWQLGKAPKIIILSWRPPPIDWIKVNTNGLAKGNPGPAACGGVFRNYYGDFFGGFGLALGHQSSFFSKIMAVILAIEIAYNNGWLNLWLESDSLLVVQLLLSDSLLPPWTLHNRWLNCKNLISKMNFRWTHAFREVNSVADALANLDLFCDSLHWWSTYPSSLVACYCSAAIFCSLRAVSPVFMLLPAI
ncbi:Ribonuclease H protein [Melia azedarach]|uniref:Ribonuclease H protein n=1 Tax=Melia azedarach TaxID=155640 RepID=A0ACC1XR46_MELAZ|nr:Ribonuclease H protein [Melia azedarach]